MIDKFLSVFDGVYFVDVHIRLPSDLPIVVDWDNTIVNTEDQYRHAILKSTRLYGTHERFTEFEDEVPLVRTHFGDALLSSLDRKVTLVSNKDRAHLLNEIHSLGVDDKFDNIIGNAGKPNGWEYLKTIGDVGLMIGDRAVNDGVYAEKAGWHYLHIPTKLLHMPIREMTVNTSLTLNEITKLQAIFGG